ncbi:alanine--glyoxylate aminotransferase family protein [Methanococcoides orientis]|uniref:pyridoxal-phosphate-dependent aminotransferase family protein n=1 Tax=Methanococcoides orientis TaxID=2822137 RepID=UPI001E355B45|nr:alanine--glyoxylate aminotransferase family protein [Methanococcoides orientis]UGV41300.1 alanine--glyoxylate aminotransferase family protein [Methanococcoides orientis]
MDLEDTLLMMPGPVPVAPKVLRAMSKPMINHRGKEFSAMFDDCTAMLKEIFQTQNDLMIVSGSGTASMEAAIGCTIDKDDKVVAIENGKFGERFKDIAARYGQVVPLEFEWGQSVDLDLVEEKLAEGAKAVTMVHNETSAGIRNPAPEVGKLAKKYDALFIMDGVTSIGGDDVKVDEWGVDIAVVGSQKCVAAPPGLSMLSVSERAFEAMTKENLPYYLDLKAYKKSADKSQTPYTPAVPLFFGLQEALKIVMDEGMEARAKRQATGAAAIRAAMDAMGIEMFPQLNEVSGYSNTVSAMKAPEGVSGNDIKSGMMDKGIIIAGGQNRLSGQIFRIGSMGNVAPKDIMLTIQELELVLKKLGVVNAIGAGTEAAASVLDTL